jgi:hypothetical protein
MDPEDHARIEMQARKRFVGSGEKHKFSDVQSPRNSRYPPVKATSPKHHYKPNAVLHEDAVHTHAPHHSQIRDGPQTLPSTIDTYAHPYAGGHEYVHAKPHALLHVNLPQPRLESAREQLKVDEALQPRFTHENPLVADETVADL